MMRRSPPNLNLRPNSKSNRENMTADSRAYSPESPRRSPMKKIAIFVCGFLAGVIALVAFQQLQLRLFPYRHATPGNFDIRFATERESFQVDYDKPVFLTDKSGAQFKLEFTPASDGRIDYTWSEVTDSNRRGSGTVFEKYKTVGKTPDGVKVKDIGSQLRIKIEALQIEWSSGGPSSGFIYYHPDDLTPSETLNGEQDAAGQPATSP